MGRFMSPDWAAKAMPVPYAKLDNPQSLNLYGYVGNNPLSRTDPDGHYSCTGSKENCQQVKEALGNIREAVNSGNLSKGQVAALNKVLNFYGPLQKAGKDNGVSVAFSDKGFASTSTENGRTTVTLNMGQMNKQFSNRNDGSSVDTEKAATVAHEGTHGVQQKATGMASSPAEEVRRERQAYTVQSYVNQGEQDDSAYGFWTNSGGFNGSAVNSYAQKSADDDNKKD